MTEPSKMLRECPFCGSQAEIIKRHSTGFDLPWSIACTSNITKDCFLYSGKEERDLDDPRAWDDVLVWYRTKGAAIKAWNTRTQPQSLKPISTEAIWDIVEELEKEGLIALNQTDRALVNKLAKRLGQPSTKESVTVDLEGLDIILENLFQRGFNHGTAEGRSNDGEFYAVQDAKKSILKLLKERGL